MKESKITENVRKFIRADDVLAIAVSGGVDSMVLLHAVIHSGILGAKSIFVVNVEHGIRGEQSKADSRFVEKFCRENGVAFRGFSVDALSYAQNNGVTLEEGARALRYGIFQKLLDDGDCDKVALAHHRADQAETVLMRILRGTGIAGLIGMREESGGYIRPLLSVGKKEIEDYRGEHDVPFVTDMTNFDNAYTRNLIRNDILPAVNKLSLDAESGLTRLSRLAAENEDFIARYDNPVDVGDGYATMVLIEGEHPLLFKRRVRKCFLHLGVTQDVEERHAELIYGLTKLPNGAALDMPYGVKVSREYDKLTFVRSCPKKDFSMPYRTGDVRFSDKTVKIISYAGEKLNKGELIFDSAAIPPSAVFRNRREKDRFTKFKGGTKSLGDYLTDKKIPLRIRDNLMLCADGNEVLFIVGVEISDGIKITENTKKTDIYKITAED